MWTQIFVNMKYTCQVMQQSKCGVVTCSLMLEIMSPRVEMFFTWTLELHAWLYYFYMPKSVGNVVSIHWKWGHCREVMVFMLKLGEIGLFSCLNLGSWTMKMVLLLNFMGLCCQNFGWKGELSREVWVLLPYYLESKCGIGHARYRVVRYIFWYICTMLTMFICRITCHHAPNAQVHLVGLGPPAAEKDPRTSLQYCGARFTIVGQFDMA